MNRGGNLRRKYEKFTRIYGKIYEENTKKTWIRGKIYGKNMQIYENLRENF